MSGFKLPAEITQNILEHVAEIRDIDSRYRIPRDAIQPMSRYERPTIARMRLVNRTFCDCATPLLFQEFDTCFIRTQGGSSSNWASRLLSFSTSPLTDHVKSLKIGFDRSDFVKDNVEEYLLEAAYIIPRLVGACRKMRSLDIQGPSTWPLPGFDSIHRRLFMQTLNQVFRVICQKRDDESPDTIAISLPCTHDYVDLVSRLSHFPSEAAPRTFSQLMQAVRHLKVRVADASGAGGKRYWQDPESACQQKYPNRVHQQGYWDFISTATNLQSLTLLCTHALKFDLLLVNIFPNLRELSLSGFHMSQKHFVKLVSQNSSRLRAIQLLNTQLNSGTWESTLLHLCSLPALDHFFMNSCGYTSTGDSRRYANLLLPPPDAPQDIETLHFEDNYSLGYLQRHTNHIRAKANMALYTENDQTAVKFLEEFDPLTVEE